MEPVSLIVAALAAGAVAGAQNTATEAVKDAYAALKALIKRRFADPQAAEVVEQHAAKPDRYTTVLEEELADVDAGADERAVAAAQRLMELLDAEGTQAGRYVVDARGAQGLQVGDHNTQTNSFGNSSTTI